MLGVQTIREVFGWDLPAPLILFDFVNNRYRQDGVGSSSAIADFLTVTRASVGLAENALGGWSSFGTGVARRTDKGLLVEPIRTNVVLWNRDLTNVAWTAVNITALKDQAGIEGTASAASKITAGAANGTILQAITLGSSARFQSAFVKRITGTGVVQMTMDNGSTWTTVPVTSAWARVSIPSQTLANPTVGFRLVTSGDAIAVDFVQNENNGFAASSPIAVTTVAVARAADIAAASTLLALGSTYSVFGEGTPQTPTTNTASQILLSLDDGTLNNRSQMSRNGGGTNVAAIVGITGGATFWSTSAGSALLQDAKFALAARISPFNQAFAARGRAGPNMASNKTGTPAVPSQIHIGAAANATGQFDGYIAGIAIWRLGVPDLMLESMVR